MERQRRKGRRIAGFAVVLLCAFLAGCGAEAAPSYTKQGMEAVAALDYEKALALFQTAEENGEEKRLLYRGMGLAYLGKTEYDAAITYLEAALRLGSGRVENLDFDINYYLATAYYKIGRLEDAVAFTTRFSGSDRRRRTRTI